jgi:hypothetical protein
MGPPALEREKKNLWSSTAIREDMEDLLCLYFNKDESHKMGGKYKTNTCPITPSPFLTYTRTGKHSANGLITDVQ